MHIIYSQISCLIISSFVSTIDYSLEVQQLASDIGELCGRDIERLPTVKVVRSTAFRAEVESCIKAQRESDEVVSAISAGTHMFYSFRSNAIFVRDGLEPGEVMAQNVEEIEGYRRLSLIHELSHAWQYERFPTLFKGPDSETKAAIREGHAHWVTAKYAERHGVLRLWERIHSGLCRRRNAIGAPNEIDVYFFYVESFLFFEHLASLKPPIQPAVIMTSGLPTQREIAYPEEYSVLNRSRVSSWSWLSLPDGGRIERASRELSEVTFVAVRSHMRQLGYGGRALDQHMRGFGGGARVKAAPYELTVLSFENMDASNWCAQQFCHYFRVSDNDEQHTCISGTDDPDIKVYCLPLINKGKSVSVGILIVEGTFVAEARMHGVDPSPPSVNAARSQLASWYMVIRRKRLATVE